MRRSLATLLVLLAPSALGAQRTWHPTITGVAPSLVQHGSTLTLSGFDLNPPGWQRRFHGGHRYAGGGGILVLQGSGSSTQIALSADKYWGGDSAHVEWVEIDTSQSRSNPVPVNERKRYLPSAFVVQAPPDVTFPGTQVTPDLGPSFHLMTVVNGQGVIKGKWLRRTSYPTVTFAGAARQVLAHAYEPRGWLTREASCCDTGADRLVFAPPSQKTTGWLVVDNSLGRDSAAVTFALPPAPAQVVEQTQAGSAALSPASTLQRGRTYIVRGQHLSVTHALGGSTSIKRGTIQLGSTAITPVFASDTNIVFSVPTTLSATSAALNVVTLVGTASLGTFSIISPPVPINVTAVTPRPSIVTAGKPVQFFATLDIPRGVNNGLGSLVITTPGTPPGALRIRSSIDVTGPSTEVKVEGGDVQVTTPVTLSIAHESNGVNGITTQTQQLKFSVRPPHPIRIEPPPTVTAGSSQEFKVHFDSATATTSTIFALLSSSNPNVVPVPASATLSRDVARFTVTIPPAAQAGGAATITASLDGATVSLPVSVQLPQVQQVTAYRERFSDVVTSGLPGALVRAEALFNGVLASPSGVSITASDTALRGEQNSLDGLDASGTKFSRFYRVSSGLSQQRQVTLTASYGGTSRTTSITLNPVVISTFVPTPASGSAGAKVTATALLSVPAAVSMYMDVASADTSLATVSPAGGSIAPGGTSRVVSIVLKGPVTSPRQVPITATLRAGGPGGTIVSVQTAVVTVNP